MGHLVNELANIVANEQVGPRLHIITLNAPLIAASIKPGQFVHLKIPGRAEHILRRPFSVYARDAGAQTLDILYQQVGSMTDYLPEVQSGQVELIGPIGNTWAPSREEGALPSRALLVGGGVGAAPLYLLAESLKARGVPFDVVLGSQTKDALVARERYADLLGMEPVCSTDDGSYGYAGFCTPLVAERLSEGSSFDGKPYDYLAVCGPEPLMKLVAGLARDEEVFCEVSLEKRMACGVGACLSCVVETTTGKRRSCVDGPIFDAEEVIW